ncbi:MAG: hypothetical protein R6W06_10300 [Prochlorococcaceae cyanobacterium]
MAFPHSLPSGSVGSAGGASITEAPLSTSPTPGCQRSRQDVGSYIEGGHQLEKLQFALAVAISRADQARIQYLRSQIHALGGNREEPGT